MICLRIDEILQTCMTKQEFYYELIKLQTEIDKDNDNKYLFKKNE